MTVTMFFNLLLCSCAGFAIWRGGAPERVAAGSLLLAALATALQLHSVPGAVSNGRNRGVMVTDMLLVAALYSLALRSNRIWPMLLAALQLSSVLVHLAKIVDLAMAAWVYQFLLKIWAYPMIALLVVGTVRHREARALRGRPGLGALRWRPPTAISLPGRPPAAPPCSPRPSSGRRFAHASV